MRALLDNPSMMVTVAVGFLVIVIGVTCPVPRSPLAILVGATAGLQTAQIAQIHVFCFAVAALVLFGVLREPRAPVAASRGALILGCAAVLGSSVFTGALVNSTLFAVQFLLLAGTAGLIAVLARPTDVRDMLQGFLLMTTIAATAGVLQYLRILPHELFLGDDRPVGLYSEPDWLGLFSAAGLVVAFYWRPGSLRTIVMVVHLAALLLAAARAAWLAVLAAAVVGYVGSRFVPQDLRPKGGFRLLAMAVVAGGAMLVVSPDLREFLVTRIDGMFGDQPDVAANARQLQIGALLHLGEQAPWNGLGLSASGRVGVSGRITYIGQADNNVPSNWILGWWVDGGWLALPIILLFVVASLRRATTAEGLVLVVVLTNSLFSNATLIPVAWFALGMCMARTNPEEQMPTTRPRQRLRPSGIGVSDHDRGVK